MPTVVTSSNFEDEVLNSDIPVLVDFWASWCMPCKLMSPVMDEISDQADGFKVAKINIDDEPEIARKYGIMSIPTIGLFKSGEMVNQTIGVQPKENILNLMK